MTNRIWHVAPWMALMIAFPLLVYANGSGKWVRKEVNGSSPGFSLTDQDNRKVSLADFRGKTVLMSFIFANCTTGCLVVTAKLADVQKAIKDKELQILAITIDPGHDTPAVLKEYGKKFGADFRSWSFLTGTHDEINDILIDYKVSTQRRPTRGSSGEVLSVSLVDHAVKTLLIDQKGMKRFEYLGQDFRTKAVLEDIKKVLDNGR